MSKPGEYDASKYADSPYLKALPALASGVRFYDRMLKERDDEAKLVPVVPPVRLVQLYNPSAAPEHRLATVSIVGTELSPTPEDIAGKLHDHCKDYGFFAT